MTLVNSVDISEYQPAFNDPGYTQSFVQQYNIQHAVVRLPLPGEQGYDADVGTARAQVAALRSANVFVDGYVWHYDGRDPVETVQSALAVQPDVGTLYYDSEDSMPNSGPFDKLGWYLRAASASVKLYVRPGLYTSPGWWNGHGLSAIDGCLNWMDLWAAFWDGQANFDGWPANAFGGWSRLKGHQYSSGDHNGIGVDMNVFDLSEKFEQKQDTGMDAATEDWYRQAMGYITGDLADKLEFVLSEIRRHK